LLSLMCIPVTDSGMYMRSLYTHSYACTRIQNLIQQAHSQPARAVPPAVVAGSVVSTHTHTHTHTHKHTHTHTHAFAHIPAVVSWRQHCLPPHASRYVCKSVCVRVCQRSTTRPGPGKITKFWAAPEEGLIRKVVPLLYMYLSFILVRHRKWSD